MSTVDYNEIPEGMTALEVLRQAGDLLEVSFFIKGDEYTNFLSNGDYLTDLSPVTVPKKWAGKWTGKKKGILVNNNGHDEYLTSMCSIGALAMSRLTAVADGETEAIPRIGFDRFIDNDLATTLAGQALVNTIIRELPGEYDGNISDIPVCEFPYGIITSWNDDSQRTVAEVVDFFRKAEKDPCLKYSEVWRIQAKSPAVDGYTTMSTLYGSEQECADAITYMLACEIPLDEHGCYDERDLIGRDGMNSVQWAVLFNYGKGYDLTPVRTIGASVPA